MLRAHTISDFRRGILILRVGFSEALGEVLRRARTRVRMTLNDVEMKSGGGFKPSAVGGYERGERSISVERFCNLCKIYGIPPDRLLAELQVELGPDGRREAVIDLNRLSLLEVTQARLVADFVHKVRSQREDYLTDVITLRAGDIESLAFAAHETPRKLLADISPALKPK